LRLLARIDLPSIKVYTRYCLLTQKYGSKSSFWT
jgi:hypothetical protein